MSCRVWQKFGAGKAKSRAPASCVSGRDAPPAAGKPSLMETSGLGSMTTGLLPRHTPQLQQQPEPTIPAPLVQGGPKGLLLNQSAVVPVGQRTVLGSWLLSFHLSAEGRDDFTMDNREKQRHGNQPGSHLLRVGDVHRPQNLLWLQVCICQPSKKMFIEGNLPQAFWGKKCHFSTAVRQASFQRLAAGGEGLGPLFTETDAEAPGCDTVPVSPFPPLCRTLFSCQHSCHTYLS